MKFISLPWFTVVFSLFYIVVFAYDLSLFLYYPLPGRFSLAPLGADAGPAMHWYGMMASAAVAGLAAGVVLRDRWIPAALLSWLWLAPLAAMLASAYLLRQFFV